MEQQINTDALKATILAELKKAARLIKTRDPLMGYFAERKIKALKPESPLAVYVQVGEDVTLISEKVLNS